MNLQEIYDDLGGFREVATDLDVTVWRLKKWIERRETTNCPLPVRVLSNIHLYSMEEWRGWYRRWAATRGYEAKSRPTKGFNTPSRLHRNT